MTGLVRKAMFLAVCGLLTAGVAFAHVADPANSECHNVGAAAPPINLNCDLIKAVVYVVGNNLAGTVADPVGQFCVTVRDFNNVPIENSSVILDFTDCDVQLCNNPTLDGSVVDCPSATVRKLSDASGVACFKVRGKTKAGLGCGGAAKNCLKIFADSQLLCTGDAPTFDLVGQPAGQEGLNPSDLSEFLKQLLLCATNPPRANYACNNQVVDPSDLSAFLKVFLLLGNSPKNCPVGSPKCP
ncbi:MAG TPA: hypothetical protein VGK89_04295 [Candidatus Eisenbacteria bacterium]|jgi:hypothetical protein